MKTVLWLLVKVIATILLLGFSWGAISASEWLANQPNGFAVIGAAIAFVTAISLAFLVGWGIWAHEINQIKKKVNEWYETLEL